jgi:hypothetical protein
MNQGRADTSVKPDFAHVQEGERGKDGRMCRSSRNLGFMKGFAHVQEGERGKDGRMCRSNRKLAHVGDGVRKKEMIQMWSSSQTLLTCEKVKG